MKALKVIPEIFIWLAFSVVTGFGYAFSFLGYIDGHTRMSAANIVIPTLVWLLLAVICTLSLRAAKGSRCFVEFSKYESLFLECSVFLLLLIGGWVFRFVEYFYAVWPTELDRTYYLYAEVAQDGLGYMNPHPASGLYVRLLHTIFLFLGNNYTVGAYAQFILLLLGVFVWYFAIRKAIGKIAALFFVAGAMLLPDSISASMQCNPMMLLFVIFGIFAWLLAEYVCQRTTGFLKYIQICFLGICAMLCLMLDVSGILALLAYVVVVFLKQIRDNRQGQHAPFTIFWMIFGVLFAAWGVRFIRSGTFDVRYLIVGRLGAYEGLRFTIPDLQQIQAFAFELGKHPIFIVAVVVISVYWFLQRRSIVAWIMLGELYLLTLKFLKLDFYLPHDFLIYVGVILLLGIAAGRFLEYYNKAEADTEQELIKEEADNKEKATVPETSQETAEPMVTVVRFEEQPVVEVPLKEDRPAIFIPKTMEIPKRVSKPKVDYAVEVDNEKLHYDFPVAEDADYDIR